jgi:hypothetical protein
MTGRRGVVLLALAAAIVSMRAAPAPAPPKIVTDGVMFRTVQRRALALAAGVDVHGRTAVQPGRRLEQADLVDEAGRRQRLAGVLAACLHGLGPAEGCARKHWIHTAGQDSGHSPICWRGMGSTSSSRSWLTAEFGEDRGKRYPALNQSFEWQRGRVRDVIAAVADAPNVFLEIVNEPPSNGVDPWKIVDALGLQAKANRPVLMSSGDYRIKR